LAAARADLTIQSGDALALIFSRATSASKTALKGLVGLGTSELASAVGMVGMDIAKALGQADKVTRLYTLARDYLAKTYESLIALLGPKMAQIAGEKVTGWVEQIGEGKPVAGLLEKLYHTEQTKEALNSTIAESTAKVVQFTEAMADLEKLNATFDKKTVLIEKIMPKLKWVTMISDAAALPQGRIILAVAYVLLSGYVILTAGDYVDAPRLERLGRVLGVRCAIETRLGVAGKADAADATGAGAADADAPGAGRTGDGENGAGGTGDDETGVSLAQGE
jgi:hypothetical protein